MAIRDKFGIQLKTSACVSGLSEDALRELVNSLEIVVIDEKFEAFVTSTAGTKVKVIFGADGNWSGIKTALDGKSVTLVHGVGTAIMQVFKGTPSAQNPGAGWEVEVDLTKKYLAQPDNQADWEIFFASPAPVLNTI